MQIVGILSIYIVIYIGAILLIQVAQHCATESAIETVNGFIKKIFTALTTDKQGGADCTVNFDIYIGLDGNGNPMSNLIDNSFKDLGKIFKTFYFWGIQKRKNTLVYSFFVSESINEMDEEQLYEYCHCICDSIVHRIVHQIYPSCMHLDSLVAIQLNQNRLNVYIAENPNGQQENATLTSQIRMLMKRSQISATPPIEEDWGDLQ